MRAGWFTFVMVGAALIGCGAGAAAPRAAATQRASRFLVIATRPSNPASTELEIVGADGRLHRLVALGPLGSAAVSPNGNWIAWAGAGGIRVERRGGSHRHLLLQARCAATYKTCVGGPFVWSPDSRRLLVAEVSPTQGSGAALAVVSLASGAVHRIVGPQRHVTYDPIAWSGRANEILFTANDAGRANGVGCCSDKLIVARPSGASRRALYSAADAIHDDPAASWSPNGKWISFTTDGRASPQDPRLAIITAATGATTRVRGFGGFTEPPVWSPDSSRFAVGGYRSRLETFSPRGKKVGPLEPTSTDVRAWTRDGIYFLSGPRSSPRQLFVIPNGQKTGHAVFTLPGGQVFLSVQPM